MLVSEPLPSSSWRKLSYKLTRVPKFISIWWLVEIFTSNKTCAFVYRNYVIDGDSWTLSHFYKCLHCNNRSIIKYKLYTYILTFKLWPPLPFCAINWGWKTECRGWQKEKNISEHFVQRTTIDITAVAINNLEEKYCLAFSVMSILICVFTIKSPLLVIDVNVKG